MTKFKILFVAIVLSLTSCSKDDTNTIEEKTTEENPQAGSCKISEITYGFFSGDEVYTAIYSGENLTELISSVNKVVFTYNAQNHLTKKEYYDTGNSQIQFKSEFKTNSGGQITEQRNWEFYSGSLQYTGKEIFIYNGSELTQITSYDTDDTTIEGKFIYEWTGDNPTKLSIYDGNDALECENNIVYDLAKENKFNATFPYFAFQDIYDEDFQLYLFLGKNVVTSTTNSCSGGTNNFNISLQSDSFLDNVRLNGDLLWEFEYGCE